MKTEQLERKVFVENLPHKGKLIDWKNSIGCKINFIYDGIEDYIEIVEYIATNDASHPKLRIKYNDKYFDIPRDEFIKCQIGILFNKRTLKFKIEIGTKFQDDKRNLIITDREYRKEKHGKSLVNEKWYKCTCNNCKWDEGWIEEGKLLNNGGCSCCYGKTPVLGINTIWDTDKWMIPIINDDEFCKTHTHSCSDKIYSTCPDCGTIKDKKITINRIYQNHSTTCICSDSISYPNKLGYEILNQLNKIYKFDYIEHEYSPDWIKPKRYDNYFIYNKKVVNKG